jgi:cobalamin-dependent methionine synthase I
MSYIIFSVDNYQDLSEYQAVVRYLSKVSMDMTGNFISCFGMYEHKIEPSYICREDDYEKFIKDKWFMDNQECVTRVLDDKHMTAFLVYPDGTNEHIGKMVSVDYDTAATAIGWTYRPDMYNTYWIAQ